MKARALTAAVMVMVLVPALVAPAQTTRRTTSSRTSTSGNRTLGTSIGSGTGSGTMSPNWFVMTIIGNFLRHPNALIRKQAVQALVSGMSGGGLGIAGTGLNNNTGNTGVYGSSNTSYGNYNSNYNNNNANNNNSGTGGSPILYIPDLYALLNDPDKEVADLASIGLDTIFGTDMTILRFMNDEDPIIRRYATKVFLERNLGGGGGRTSGRATTTSGSTSLAASSQDAAQLKAIQMAASENNDTMLKRLMDMLATETDDELKQAISSAIDSISGTSGGRARAPMGGGGPSPIFAPSPMTGGPVAPMPFN